jgi:phage N-6-adenine-methyltransferase
VEASGVAMSDEIFTPKWIFDAIGVQFDLDVASSDNPLVQVPTNKFYTINDDSLNQEWIGKVWMNPPFSKVTPWIEKWIDHDNGFCLVPL